MANRGYLVPESLFFVRNHAVSPIINPQAWRLRIEGDGINTPQELSYDDLLKLPAVTVTRYVECAGNGRSFFDTFMSRPAQGSA